MHYLHHEDQRDAFFTIPKLLEGARPPLGDEVERVEAASPPLAPNVVRSVHSTAMHYVVYGSRSTRASSASRLLRREGTLHAIASSATLPANGQARRREAEARPQRRQWRCRRAGGSGGGGGGGEGGTRVWERERCGSFRERSPGSATRGGAAHLSQRRARSTRVAVASEECVSKQQMRARVGAGGRDSSRWTRPTRPSRAWESGSGHHDGEVRPAEEMGPRTRARHRHSCEVRSRVG